MSDTESHLRLERIVAKNPTSILFARLADRYLTDGQVARATETCRRGLRYRPSYATGHLVLGRCHQAAGRLEEARQEFLKVLQLDSDNLAAFLYLGRTEAAMGNAREGLSCLSRALLLDPFNTALAAEVASVKGALGIPDSGPPPPEVAGQTDDSVGPTRDAVGAQPARDEPTESPEQLGSGDAPRRPDSREPQDSDDSPNPSDPPIPNRSAARQARAAGDTGPQPFVSLTLADLYLAQGHRGMALGVLRRVLSRQPENEAARRRLGQLESSESETSPPGAGAKEP